MEKNYNKITRVVYNDTIYLVIELLDGSKIWLCQKFIEKVLK